MCVNMNMCVSCVFINMHVCLWVWLGTYIHIWICMYVSVYKCIYMYKCNTICSAVMGLSFLLCTLMTHIWLWSFILLTKYLRAQLWWLRFIGLCLVGGAGLPGRCFLKDIFCFWTPFVFVFSSWLTEVSSILHYIFLLPCCSAYLSVGAKGLWIKDSYTMSQSETPSYKIK